MSTRDITFSEQSEISGTALPPASTLPKGFARTVGGAPGAAAAASARARTVLRLENDAPADLGRFPAALW